MLGRDPGLGSTVTEVIPGKQESDTGLQCRYRYDVKFGYCVPNKCLQEKEKNTFIKTVNAERSKGKCTLA